MPDSFFDFWWIILFFAGFGIVEAIAIVRKRPNDTLSEKVWTWFCLRGKKQGKSTGCILRRIFFYAFWIWLTVHFLSGGEIL